MASGASACPQISEIGDFVDLTIVDAEVIEPYRDGDASELQSSEINRFKSLGCEPLPAERAKGPWSPPATIGLHWSSWIF